MVRLAIWIVAAALAAPGCERSPPDRETTTVTEQVVSTDDVAEHVIAKLVAGAVADVPDLGSFEVDEYKAYEGRNPRTGERVQVPEKRLPRFTIDDALREYVNGRGTAPKTAWVAALLGELRTGRLIVFGRMGAFWLRTKAGARVLDSQTGTMVEAPARTVLLFTPSKQLKRLVAGEAAAPVVDSAALDAMLARLPREPPRTLAELDATFAALGFDYQANRVVAPSKRETDDSGLTVIGVNEDGEARWYFDGTSCFEDRNAKHPDTRVADGDEQITFPADGWMAELLVVAAARTVAGDGLLRARDAERVLALLGPSPAFTLPDLPY